MQNLFKVANVDEKNPNEECNKLFPGEEWKCFYIQNTYSTITGKFMVVNSEYDAWAIPNLLKIKCLSKGTSGETLKNCNDTQMAYIEEYRASYKETLGKFIESNPELSVWSIACSQHVYACENAIYDSPHQKIPTATGKTVRNVVEDFVLRGIKSITFDAQPWPSNSGCAM
jgi:hypothetical protein